MQVLGFDLLKSGIFSVLPWITMAVFANVGGWLADSMVSKGVSVTTVRKVMQTVRLTYLLYCLKRSTSLLQASSDGVLNHKGQSWKYLTLAVSDLGEDHRLSETDLSK